jgi:hypothetical protein
VKKRSASLLLSPSFSLSFSLSLPLCLARSVSAPLLLFHARSPALSPALARSLLLFFFFSTHSLSCALSPHSLLHALRVSAPLLFSALALLRSLGLCPSSFFFPRILSRALSVGLYARLGVRVHLGVLPRKGNRRRLHFTPCFIGTAPKQIVSRPTEAPGRRAWHHQVALDEDFQVPWVLGVDHASPRRATFPKRSRREARFRSVTAIFSIAHYTSRALARS